MSESHQGDSGFCQEGYGAYQQFLTFLVSVLCGPFANTTHFQGTSDVRLDPQLNKKVWESGIKGVPFRLRVRISRKRNDEEGAKEKLYSYVQAVNVKNPKGLQTAVVEDTS